MKSAAYPAAPPPRVLLACSGLDHAHRGFESFARECFDALRDEPGLRLELVKGSGSTTGDAERAIPTLRRDRPAARAVGRVSGARSYRVEALSFGLSLQPLLLARRPDVVYLSEWDTARALARSRAVTRLSFKLLLCNGGFAERGFEHLDHVQELTPAARDHVLREGADPARHSVLPLGFDIPQELNEVSPDQRSRLRAELRLPLQRQVVISVAALNRHHKRLDYVIEEVAALPEPRPYLLLAGEPDEETPGLRMLARDRLGEDGYDMRTVPAERVHDLLRASDVFVLASTAEAQGRALVEAMIHGLPCVTHDSPVMRYALGEHGRFGDLRRSGELRRLLLEHPERGGDAARARHRHVYERFSWKRLRPRYVRLLRDVAYGAASASEELTAKRTVSSSTGEDVFK